MKEVRKEGDENNYDSEGVDGFRRQLHSGSILSQKKKRREN